MGDVVDLRPRVVIAEQFQHVADAAELGRYKLVIARSMLEGVPHLSLILTGLPAYVGFEILATIREDDTSRLALDFMVTAIRLVAQHIATDELL